jgi:hypothetical protein
MDTNQNYTPEVETTIPAQENGKPLKKKQYLFSAAPQKTRIVSFVALGLAALFMLLIVIGTISVLTRPLWDIPLFEMTVSKSDLNEMEDRCEDALDAIEEALDEDDEYAIQDLEDEFDMNIKELKKTFENPSIANFSKIFVIADEEEATMAAGLLIFLILGGAAIILLFAALATLFLKKGLLILSYILAMPFFILFAGTTIMVLCGIVLVAFIVVQTIVNGYYKSYKKSFAN